MAAGLPKATWGQAAIGLSPTVISMLRAETAAATCINQPGRRRTTAILIAYGHRQDPAVKLAGDAVLLWLDLWRENPGSDPTGGWPGGAHMRNSWWTAK